MAFVRRVGRMTVCKMRYSEAAEIVAEGKLELLQRCPEEEAVYKEHITNIKLEWATVGETSLVIV